MRTGERSPRCRRSDETPTGRTTLPRGDRTQGVAPKNLDFVELRDCAQPSIAAGIASVAVSVVPPLARCLEGTEMAVDASAFALLAGQV
jgi:hypothetical protein